MHFSEFDFNCARGILETYHPEVLKEVKEVIAQLAIPLGRGHRPTPSKRILDAFKRRGWERETKIENLRFDLFRPAERDAAEVPLTDPQDAGRPTRRAARGVAAEVQLTDPQDCYNDLLKFLVARDADLIDLGIEVVYDDSVRGNNLPRLSTLRDVLERFRATLHCPVWVIGLREGEMR